MLGASTEFRQTSFRQQLYRRRVSYFSTVVIKHQDPRRLREGPEGESVTAGDVAGAGTGSGEITSQPHTGSKTPGQGMWSRLSPVPSEGLHPARLCRLPGAPGLPTQHPHQWPRAHMQEPARQPGLFLRPLHSWELLLASDSVHQKATQAQ